MDQQNPTTSAITTTPQPAEPQSLSQPQSQPQSQDSHPRPPAQPLSNPQPSPPSQSQLQSQPFSSLPHPSSTIVTPSTSTPLPPSPNPNPIPSPSPSPLPSQNPIPKLTTPLLSHQSQQHHPQVLPSPAQIRPTSTLGRTWHPSHISSSAGSPSTSSPPPPRGGMAIGLPTHHPSHTPQPAPFSSSYGQHVGGLGRGSVSLPEPISSSSSSQLRPTMQGVQGMGMLGSLGSSSQMRPGGIPIHHQQRHTQSSLRQPSTPNNQSPSSQSFHGHGLSRVSSTGTPAAPSPSTSQSMQPHNQSWLSTGSQGKPPLAPPSYRQQLNSPSIQQQSHVPQQPMSSMQVQQPSPSHQMHERYGQQGLPSRVPQTLSHQQQITRVPNSVNQMSSPAVVQPNAGQLGSQNKMGAAESEEPCNRILSKRSIHELVSQIDPSEKLDPEVEDILMDIADDFVESITTFGCSLAKHRKSTTLDAKDILLPLEKNWNITLPGFGGDEIKSYRKPITNDIHKERLAVIKKSMLTNDGANIRSSTGQAPTNAKSGLVKAPVSLIGSPNVKHSCH